MHYHETLKIYFYLLEQLERDILMLVVRCHV